jgi:signal transduction histidine kinase
VRNRLVRRALACRDLLLAAALCAGGEFELASGATYSGRPVWPGSHLATALIIPALTLPLAWRRRRPLAVCLLLFAGLAASNAALGGGEATTEFLLFITLAFTGAAYTDRPLLIAVAAVGAGAVHEVRDPSVHGVGDVVWAAGMLAIAMLLGRAVHARQHRIGVLQREAVVRDQEHAATVAAATAAERAAIARELHDIVAHAVSVVVIQSQAGSRALPARPELAAQTLATIESTARTALNDLRRLLTVLGSSDNNEASSRPLGSLSDLDELLATFRSSGLSVRIDAPSPLPQLTPAAELAAYRVVQESLTNAARYARGSEVAVTLRDDDGSLSIEVVNTAGEQSADTDGLGAGRGLIGMRQRLELVGGELLHAGPRNDGYAVTARIPLAANELQRVREPVA